MTEIDLPKDLDTRASGLGNIENHRAGVTCTGWLQLASTGVVGPFPRAREDK
ncbi:MAG: hypothetical protein QGI17_07690 [Arenicellales bacterium]|jgi:hypothetical protein|nr:hypothetical protein [Pseudomonadales bacterium]MDP7516981.1 hypothetical protein [Arenicellales bacterium]